jgi:tRNA A-37 threonylcarbamoyl transferase component Bud32/tetratricopeptide (TPR) repeat protein
LGGAYTVERELGGGGMSRTYVANETALGRKVVVKMLSPELAAGVSVERFKREIQLAATLQHPHVVPVLATGDADGLPWFTMPYVEGESLRARLAHGPLRIVEATAILKDVARALEFAHSHGIVHRDIKPDNVLLAGSSATVTDFGIAKALSAARDTQPGHALTMTGTSIGTPMYMAPEQAAGDPNVDQRSDIYSFGVVAYELLAGEPPFDGSSPVRLMQAHFSETPPDIRQVRGDTPPVLADLVMRCLEKSPQARPQTASDLVRVLETVTSSGAVEAAPVLLQAPMKLGRALIAWFVATLAVGVTAWAATNVIGLPDWVFPGSLGVMVAGLPAILVTWYVQRAARRAYSATPVFTTGGSRSRQGTIATIALKAAPHVSWYRTWLGGAIAVGAFAVLVVGFMVMRAFGIGPAASLIGAGKLAQNDRIIITDFASPLGDSTLGLTITEALRADLEQTSVVRVMPRLATIEVLRLMQRPPDTRVDFALARAIATREGMKAVLDGDVVSLGGRYVLSTRLISANDGAQLAAFKEEAASQNDLIPAIGRLGKQLRAKMGESLRNVRAAGALDRVTTSSMDALRKYVEANVTFDRTGDTRASIGLMKEAVAIDSTFGMAWRRMAMYYGGSLGEFQQARDAAVQAYRYADRLSEVERQLTIAAYYSYGPTVDDDKTLAAYEAALARDSLNFIALNNASLILGQRREWRKALAYRVLAAAQPATNPIAFSNALAAAVNVGDWRVLDSLGAEFQRRFPTYPVAINAPARGAALRGEFDRADSLEHLVEPQLTATRSGAVLHLGFGADMALLRGQVQRSLQLRAQQHARQLEAPSPSPVDRLNIGLDSVVAQAVVLDDARAAQAMLARALQRAPMDSIPFLNRNYDFYLAVAALTGDTARAREWHAEARRSWVESGNTVSRPAWEAYDDASLALARGRYAEAAASLRESDRRNMPRIDALNSMRFLVFDRMHQPDSTIAAGEEYLRITHPNRLGQDVLYLASVRQRLGELYEAKGMPDKALAHYTAFVDLWKNADPELQPRVRDVRGRIERLRAQIAKKG